MDVDIAVLGRWSRLVAVSAGLVRAGAVRALKAQQDVLAADSQRDLNGVPPWQS
jgi:hypothetical protein